jgi:transposase
VDITEETLTLFNSAGQIIQERSFSELAKLNEDVDHSVCHDIDNCDHSDCHNADDCHENCMTQDDVKEARSEGREEGQDNIANKASKIAEDIRNKLEDIKKLHEAGSDDIDFSSLEDLIDNLEDL